MDRHLWSKRLKSISPAKLPTKYKNPRIIFRLFLRSLDRIRPDDNLSFVSSLCTNINAYFIDIRRLLSTLHRLGGIELINTLQIYLTYTNSGHKETPSSVNEIVSCCSAFVKQVQQREKKSSQPSSPFLFYSPS